MSKKYSIRSNMFLSRSLIIVYYDDLDDEQINILNERIEAYETNPDQSTISLTDFKQRIKVKYGL